MANIITRKANTISANRFLVGAAAKAFRTLVTDHNGKIVSDSKEFYKATFDEKETASRVCDALNALYAEHNVRMPEPKKAKGSAPKTEKKLSLDDFVKSKPDCSREEASAYGFKGTRKELKALKVSLGVR